jgi:hypothetical protein
MIAMNVHTISAPAQTNIEPNLTTRYFKQLGGNDFTFQTFCDNKINPDRTLTRVIPSVNVDLLNQLHAQGAGIYITVNETDGKGRRTSESIVRIRAVWQEDDDGYAGEFPLTPSMVIESSPGHYHRYWIVSDNWPADENGRADFDNVMRRMVESYGSDKNAKDLPRVLRVPGYLNRKNGAPHLVRIVALSGKRYTRAEICAAFPPVVENKTAKVLPFTGAVPADADRIRDALRYINADDREVWRNVGMALKLEFGDAGHSLWDEWSHSSSKYDERGQNTAWQSFKREDGVTIATLFHYAKQGGWKDDNYNGYFVDLPKAEQPKTDAGPQAEPADEIPENVTIDDFYAYLPEHKYIFVPTRSMWPAASVNGHIPPIDAGSRHLKPADWLDKFKPVEQMTWAPGEPPIIRDRFPSDGGFVRHDGATVFNLYRPPTIVHGDADKAGPWIEHVNRVFGEQDAKHIIQWLAQRVQRPHEKINHALVLGGSQGIGKDTALEPVKQAIGPWNFAEVKPPQFMGRFNSSFLQSVIVRVSEARDQGEFDRYKFYDHSKDYIAAPPDVLFVDEKHIKAYCIPNVTGVIITTNYKTNGIHLPQDDRRHFVAWSELDRSSFSEAYWNSLWEWYREGGYSHVAAYLSRLYLGDFNPKAPPRRTQAFWDIVDASKAPEDYEMLEAIEKLGNPDAFTLANVTAAVMNSNPPFAVYLLDRKNNRLIPHRMNECGYSAVRNPSAPASGRWKVNGRDTVIWAKKELPEPARLAAAKKIAA